MTSSQKKPAASRRRKTSVPKEWPASKVETRSVSTLVPYARNARTHTKQQVRQIAASIREWGWTNPVLIDEKDGIIAGHGRVLAAELEGIETVPVMVARGWSDAQRRAYVIADNKLALEAGWDMELLGGELEELRGLDFDLSLTGFDVAELGEIIGNDALARADAAVVQPLPRVAISALGDRWSLGEHILVCADSSDEAAWTGVEAAMVWTDPPYGVDYIGKTDEALTIDNDDAKGLAAMLEGALGQTAAHCAAGAAWYVAAPAGPQFLDFANVLTDLGVWRQTLVWLKDTLVPGRSDYHYRHEEMFYGWKPGGAHKFHGDRKNDSVWEIPRPQRNKEHPTMKPLALIARSLELSSAEGDLVVDPFAGSGSTMMACDALGRRCFSIELDPRYVDVAIRRWQEHTGELAVLEGDGRSFASIEVGGR